MNINFNEIIKKSLAYIIAVFLAFLISTALYIFLPKTAPIVIENQNKSLKYNKYNVYSSLKEKTIKKKVKKKKTIVKKKKEYQLINNILLKAIYAMADNKGFITISEKSSKKVFNLTIDEKFKDYTLKFIYPKYVIFNKGNSDYKLTMIEDKDISTKYTIEEIPEIEEKKIKKVDNGFVLKKDLLDEYMDDYEKIWKEIAITEIMKDGVIDGFRINNLSKNSIFKSLGLKIGDVIKSVNNIELKSYVDAFDIYQNMNDIKNLHIVLIRKDKQMELDYEIK